MPPSQSRPIWLGSFDRDFLNLAGWRSLLLAFQSRNLSTPEAATPAPAAGREQNSKCGLHICLGMSWAVPQKCLSYVGYWGFLCRCSNAELHIVPPVNYEDKLFSPSLHSLSNAKLVTKNPPLTSLIQLNASNQQLPQSFFFLFYLWPKTHQRVSVHPVLITLCASNLPSPLLACNTCCQM